MIHLEQNPRVTKGIAREVAECGATVDASQCCSGPGWITCPKCCTIATQRAQAARLLAPDTGGENGK